MVETPGIKYAQFQNDWIIEIRETFHKLLKKMIKKYTFFNYLVNGLGLMLLILSIENKPILLVWILQNYLNAWFISDMLVGVLASSIFNGVVA